MLSSQLHALSVSSLPQCQGLCFIINVIPSLLFPLSSPPIQADVRFPKNMSDNCKSILAGLMHKDPKRRLEWGESDVEEMRGDVEEVRSGWDGVKVM